MKAHSVYLNCTYFENGINIIYSTGPSIPHIKKIRKFKYFVFGVAKYYKTLFLNVIKNYVAEASILWYFNTGENYTIVNMEI